MKKLTVTIGVCAYNEEFNILNVLSSIVAQHGSSFVLEKIYVICDNSIDNTPKITQAFAQLYQHIVVIHERTRKGKVARLNQLYALNTSDIFINFDADIMLGSTDTVEKMVQAFDDTETVIAVAHQIPVKPETFIGKIIYAGYQFWDMTRLSIKNQDHIQNLYGAATALRKSFVSKFRFAGDITDDRGYLYIVAKHHGRFRYLMDAIIYYHPVSTLREFCTLADRSFQKNQDALVKHFSIEVYSMYYIPWSYKARAIGTVFLKSPFYTMLALILNIYTRLFPIHDTLYEKGMWEISTSTKKAVSLNIPLSKVPTRQ